MPEEKEQEIKYEEGNDEDATGDLAEKIKKLKEQLKQCQQEKHDNLAGWQRAQADFINYRRRQEEQMSDWSKMFGEGLLRDILPALDTLDASIAQSGEKENGLAGVRDQLLKILSRHGLTEIKAIGEKFNPEIHEAVEIVEEEEGEGMVTAEVQKGYSLNGKVLRPAKVKINKIN